jgi:hypothetical protein
MPKLLLESEFLTVNLNSILNNNNKPFNKTSQETPKQEQKKDLSQISDWSKELKDRLAANSQLAADSRKSEYDIESEFFEDYFMQGHIEWKDNKCSAQLLALGEPIKTAIKALGIDKTKNPILGFITDSYLIKSLLQPKLLNINTFKAIYNAVAKKLVADSEFLKSNDYNIIYCQDLYKKSAKDMEDYLTLQRTILSPSAYTYTIENRNTNKKVFFYISTIKELDPVKRKVEITKLPADTVLPAATSASTTLNTLDLANAISGNSVESGNAKDSRATAQIVKAVDVAEQLSNKAQYFAVIQYFSMATKVLEAKQALKHPDFKNIPAEQMVTATTQIAPFMYKVRLPENEVKALISILLNKLNK